MTDTYKELPDEDMSEFDAQSDQTRFGWEKPIFEKNTQPVAPVTKPAVIGVRPWYRQPITLALLAVLATLGLISLLLLLLMPKAPVISEVEPTPSPVVSQVSDPLKQKILQLRSELEAADPNRQEYPFPPVNLELQVVTPR